MIGINSAIVTIQTENTSSHSIPVKKEKRGVFGFGVHGNHHYPHQYDELHQVHYPNHLHHHHQGPPPPPPPAPVNLGAHFHTTVTKKIGVPIPYPFPVKVKWKQLKHCLFLSSNTQENSLFNHSKLQNKCLHQNLKEDETMFKKCKLSFSDTGSQPEVIALAMC